MNMTKIGYAILIVILLIFALNSCVYPAYPWCATTISGGVRCHNTPPEWRSRRGARELERHLARHACAVKQIKDRNYLMCPNTEDTPPHYLLTECELWREYCLPIRN